MSKGKQSHPWIDRDLIRQMHKRDKLYSKAKKTKSQRLWNSYKKQRNFVTSQIRQAHHNYMEDVLGPSLETNPKKFWSFVRFQRREAVGIPTLSSNGTNHVTDSAKAEALNSQFSSVFTCENLTNVPSKPESQCNSITDLDIELAGVVKQLQKLNVTKAGGPDNITARVLHDYAEDLAPMLHFIFRQSYSSGTLPQDWRKASVTAIYKKGSTSSPENYRPVSLTCISCKILEHIVLSHVSKHLSSNNIIIDNQHGFREKRSCETQLIDAVQDWCECLNRSGQTDVLLLDFSKAFDKVPHQRLAVKLRHYGIDDRWKNSELDPRVLKVAENSVSL